MIVLALLLTAQDAGFNPHLATCWTDPNCAATYMGGRDGLEGHHTRGSVTGSRTGLVPMGSPERSGEGQEVGSAADARHGAGPLCNGDLTTDRRCLGTPRAELGEGIELSGNSGRFASGTLYPAYDATGLDVVGRGASSAINCGPGDKYWPHCVRTDPSVYFPPMRNGYLGQLSADFREQLRSQILRPDEPAVKIIDDHTFLIRRDQLAYFAVLWRLCPSCVEVRDGSRTTAETMQLPVPDSQQAAGLRRGGPARRHELGRDSAAGGGITAGSNPLILTWHRPHNWRQYAERQHISELMPPAGSGDTPENRETIAGLVLSPHDLRYEYVGSAGMDRTVGNAADSHVVQHDQRSGLRQLSRVQAFILERQHCTQYCGDRTPAEMQYDLNTRTATSGTRPGVVEPVVASSLPAAQLLILEVARGHWQEVIDANRAVDQWLGIPTIEPSREDWPDMGLFQHLIPADRREDW